MSSLSSDRHRDQDGVRGHQAFSHFARNVDEMEMEASK